MFYILTFLVAFSVEFFNFKKYLNWLIYVLYVVLTFVIFSYFDSKYKNYDVEYNVNLIKDTTLLTTKNGGYYINCNIRDKYYNIWVNKDKLNIYYYHTYNNVQPMLIEHCSVLDDDIYYYLFFEKPMKPSKFDLYIPIDTKMKVIQ